MKRIAIITGAAGGIGSATAQCLGEKGYALMLTDIDPVKLTSVGDELQKNGITVELCPGDLSDPQFWDVLVDQSVKTYGRVDVLVNNAAWRIGMSIRKTTLEIWEKTLRVCLTAPTFLAKSVADIMEKQTSGGVIVNISSVMAERPSGLAPAYIAAKGALNSLTKELSITYGRKGIRVVGIAPGYIDTELSNDYTDSDGDNISDMLIQQLTDFIPLGRGGQAAEIARSIAWICSEEASYLTGTTLNLDGGLLTNFNSYSAKKRQFPDEF